MAYQEEGYDYEADGRRRRRQESGYRPEESPDIYGAPPPSAEPPPEYEAPKPAEQQQPAFSPGNVLPGWDQAKWNDPNHTTTKYTAGRILAKYPATTEGLAQAWTEIKAAFPNATFNGKDKIDFGDGWGPVDVLMGASVGGESWGWIPDSSLNEGAAPGGAGAPGAGGAPGSSAESAAFKSILNRLMSQDPNVSINDPNLRPQADAYRADIMRGQRDEQAGIAEMMAAQGMGQSGAMDAEVRSSFDRAGHDIAGHNADLVAGEIKARRDEIMNALQIYGQFMSEEEQRALQWEVAQLNAQLDRERLGFSYDELEAQINRDMMIAMMGK